MSEVSTVSSLVSRLLGIALLIGCAGTLGDQIFKFQRETKLAITKQQVLYGEWNRRLLEQH